MPIELRVNNETSTLDIVILGIGEDPGEPGSNNPKAKFHLDHGSYPSSAERLMDMNNLEKVLIENGVKVFRPVNLKKQTQLFTRDIGFVIGDELFLSAMDTRQDEITGISYLTELMDPIKTIDLSKEKGIKIEGGDIVLTNDTIFVGLSARTNTKAFRYLKERFSGKKNVVQIKIVTDTNDHRDHSLHLDCVFNLIGNNCAIVYEDGIKNTAELYKHLQVPETNIFKVTPLQFISMNTNILSLNPHTVVIEKEFIELKYWLKNKGFTILEVDYKHISKLGGLFRCSTLPLRRT